MTPRVLVGGRAEGAILRSDAPINFLGSVDRKTGTIKDQNHELYGKSMGGAILVFPSGAGSSVGAYTIYSLKSGGAAPLAMVCQKADLTVATGCAVAGIPLVVTSDDEEFASLRTGGRVALDTESAAVITRVPPQPPAPASTL